MKPTAISVSKLRPHTLVRVRWVDSNFVSGWNHPREKTAKIPEIVTVGYITHVDKQVLELSSTIGMTDGDKLNPLSIPVCSITKIENLKGRFS